ncbi:dTMP kinase [Clostridium saccharobutylicum]|uniref:Thymidylate kinase n=1 Tax=Clostridium saccharobutylicum DSM 13864 TaxID=1345695 RepID=U5MK71_CLOSA|nr:dTMP kinase [Clostridium saccharobutylicum]AGX41214.1 thymidylate kinase Tmk [Clostridium saccharobutylicum DSM 13864]AQR88500.1 thymidylate kinase [Clostridium saccharobutylicum]AQR98398.1 thymidylate kinase [Clostridium saccharobutylicum]AQS08109.1 thymidylate kinase [Clostridium saccharobutylicum]AQS12388.1 thymidylate kinase [Clostridium saccharobutylicum]
MTKGLFIVFEGGEGTGKTTAIEAIYNWLIENNFKCIKTREPGGIKISEEIRQVILNKDNTAMDGRTEALLYAAARRQHLVEKVIPALQNETIVLCDRFIDSSLAYQGYARGLGIEEVMSINKFAIGEYMPDISILFDLDPKIGLERISSSNQREINRLDLEKLDFHENVRVGYNIVYENNKHRIIKIDASKSKENVISDIKKILKAKISANMN